VTAVDPSTSRLQRPATRSSGASGPATLDTLRPGEGAVVRIDRHPVAAFRGDDGTVQAVSAVCTVRDLLAAPVGRPVVRQARRHRGGRSLSGDQGRRAVEGATSRRWSKCRQL